MIVVVGNGFTNNLTQYDDFNPGSLFDPEDMEPFFFTVDDFDVEWITEGRARGMARKFVSHLTWQASRDSAPQRYDLQVNHPLTIGGTEVFLIGHGYAPRHHGPRRQRRRRLQRADDLPARRTSTFLSFGVVKAPDAATDPDRARGPVLPDVRCKVDGDPVNVIGDLRNPTLSMLAYTGDLGLDDGAAAVGLRAGQDGGPTRGQARRVDVPRGPAARQTLRAPRRRRLGHLRRGEEVEPDPDQPDAPASWSRWPASCWPWSACCCSLFIRPRRVWVRARRTEEGTVVEVAGLDRTEGGDLTEELAAIVAALQRADEAEREGRA